MIAQQQQMHWQQQQRQQQQQGQQQMHWQQQQHQQMMMAQQPVSRPATKIVPFEFKSGRTYFSHRAQVGCFVFDRLVTARMEEALTCA